MEIDNAPSRPAIRNNVQLPFGFKEGRLYFVDEVDNGLACGCQCPKCGKPLEARNAGKKNAHHFAHAKATDCNGGYESAIHLMAKQLIVDSLKLATPDFYREITLHAEDGKPFSGYIHLPKKMLSFATAVAEQTQGHLRPDITLSTSAGKLLLVEVKVSHAVTDDKKKWVRQNKLAMMEIDLSRLSRELVRDKVSFQTQVLETTENRHWVNNPKGEEELRCLRQRLQAEMNTYNERTAQEWAAKLAREKKRQQELANKRASIEEQRKKQRLAISQELVWLAQSLKPEWRQQRLARLSQSLSRSDLWHDVAERQKNWPRKLVGIDVKWGWIFNIHPIAWQTYILRDLLIYQPEKKWSNHTLKNSVIKQFGMLKEAKTLNILKQKMKAQGQERQQWYGDEGCWFLEYEENKAIPTAYVPVVQYLEYIASFGVVRWDKQTVYPQDHDLTALFKRMDDDTALQAAEKMALQQSEAARHAQLLAYQEEQQRKYEEQQRQVDARRKLCIAAEKWVFSQYAGQGLLCPSCRLIYPDQGSACCPFCHHPRSDFKISLNAYQIEKIEARYRANPNPNVSVKSHPHLTLPEALAPWVDEKPE